MSRHIFIISNHDSFFSLCLVFIFTIMRLLSHCQKFGFKYRYSTWLTNMVSIENIYVSHHLYKHKRISKLSKTRNSIYVCPCTSIPSCVLIECCFNHAVFTFDLGIFGHLDSKSTSTSYWLYGVG